MLKNAGFEGLTRPGGYTSETHTGEVHANFVTPEAWIGWWDAREGRRRPETEIIPLRDPYVGPPRRVYEGEWAVKMFVSFHAWQGGYYQLIDGLDLGRTYEAGFYAHAWCNTDGMPHAGDPGCAPMGCGPLYRLEKELPPMPGGPVQDAWWSALFQVGVQHLGPDQWPDPTFDVHWGEAAAIYNEYALVPPVEFVVHTERVAVFLRGAFRWEFRNNDAYMDAAFLAPVAEPVPYKYERYAVLFAPTTTLVEAQELVAAHYPQRRSFMFSADDVANREPRCSKVTVEVHRAQEWGGREALLNHWRTYFKEPDEVIWIGDAPQPSSPYLLGQRDPQWARVPLGYTNCGSTIGDEGCFITCLAMAQRFYGIDAEATPATVDTALGPEGYVGCMANWGGNAEHFKRVLRIAVSRGSPLQVAVHLAEGGCAMAEVAPGPPQHFVLVYENADGEYMALDPWPGEHGEQWEFALDEAESWRILTKVETPPAPRSHVGLHVQGGIGYETEYVGATGAPIKLVGGVGELLRYAVIRPDAFRVYRHWVPEQNLDRDPDEAMSAYVAEFAPQLYDLCDAMAREGIPEPHLGVEGWNEPYGTFDPRIDAAIEKDRALVRHLGALGLPVVPVVFCAAVGNPHESEFELLVELGRETQAAGGLFGYHCYWFANPSESGLVEHWPWLAGRWTEIDKVLTAHGVEVGWFSGEMGAVGGRALAGGGYVLEPHSGWRHPNCYGGDWPRYRADLVRWHEMCADWNATHGNRMRGGTVFTTFGDPPQDWATFAFLRPQMEDMAALLP